MGVKKDPNSSHDIFFNYTRTEELISQFISKMPSLQEWQTVYCKTFCL